MRKVGFRAGNHSFKTPSFDWTLFLTIVMLVIFGLIMVYDASVVQAFRDHGDNYFYIKQQMIWVALGFLCLFFFSKFNYQHLRFFAPLLFFTSIILLLAVFIPGFGVKAGGAHRWLNLWIVSIQPAEITKLTSILFFASLFSRKKTIANSSNPILPFALTIIFISIIIGILQKDLGSNLVFFFTGVAMYVFANQPLKYFWYSIPISIVGFLVFVLSSTYRKQRVLAFLDPFADPQGYSYHISQVLIALGSGGLFGLGIGQSKQKFEYIPEVTTDSIFAIVGEELGFVGSIILIGLFSYLIYQGFKIVENAQDDFGRYLAFGLTAWLGIQAMVNLGAMVSIIPLTGVPLPFISYGGSALLANLVAIGILLNISKFSRNKI